MDLGATVCVPRRPRCGVCPLHDACASRALGVADTLVLRPKRPPRPKRFAAAFWVARPGDGAVLLRRRPAKGPLGGTLEPPSTEWRPHRAWRAAEAVAAGAAPFVTHWRKHGRVRHALSSFEVEFAVLVATEPSLVPEMSDDGGVWVRQDDLEREALSSLARKVVRHAIVASTSGGV
jgi:A/G-specific adenine glycosylase